MRRNEHQHQRQNPVKASNGSYLRSPFDISSRFAELASRQVEQGGARRNLLSTATRNDEDRDGLEKANAIMRPWSRSGVGASQLSVKEKNMQRTQAEKIYGDDAQLYSKSGDATVVDDATAEAEKAKKGKKKDKVPHGAAGRFEETDHADALRADALRDASSSSSTTTRSGMKRQFGVDMRDSEAMMKMVPSHVRKQRREGGQHTNRQLDGKGEHGGGGQGTAEDDEESSLRPHVLSAPRPSHSQRPSAPARTSGVIVERAEGDDTHEESGPQEVDVRTGQKRGRDDVQSAGSFDSSAALRKPMNRLQQLQAMRESALTGGRKRR